MALVNTLKGENILPAQLYEPYTMMTWSLIHLAPAQPGFAKILIQSHHLITFMCGLNLLQKQHLVAHVVNLNVQNVQNVQNDQAVVKIPIHCVFIDFVAGGKPCLV